jgi:hypothetical protein
VYPIIFLDHSDARATVLSDLIDVGSLHQPHAERLGSELDQSIYARQGRLRHRSEVTLCVGCHADSTG